MILKHEPKVDFIKIGPGLIIEFGEPKFVVQFASVQYDNAPPPVLPEVIAAKVISTVDGEHTGEGLLITKFGETFTVTTTTSVAVQPFETPVKVYVVVPSVGTKLVPFVTPLDQLYVWAPVPFNVIDAPEHTVISVPAETRGIGFTVTTPKPWLLEHPFKVYITVKFEVDVGLTVIFWEVSFPPHKKYPPKIEGVAAKVALPPLQIVCELTETDGVSFTTKFTVEVPPVEFL